MNYEEEYNKLLVTYAELEGRFNSLQDTHNTYVGNINKGLIDKAINSKLDEINFTRTSVRELVLDSLDKSNIAIDKDGNITGVDEYVNVIKDKFPVLISEEKIIGIGKSPTPIQNIEREPIAEKESFLE